LHGRIVAAGAIITIWWGRRRPRGTGLVPLWRSTGSVGRGFEPVLPPVLVRESAMYGTGFLPTDEVNLYQVASGRLYLTGTSEVALAAPSRARDPVR